jgi:hypothetical protein
MDFDEIRNFPTVLTTDCVRKDVTVFPEGASFEFSSTGWHESLLRSYQIVEKVKWLLERGTPSAVVLELIALMEAND